jgi:rod shape-determining protein MreD
MRWVPVILFIASLLVLQSALAGRLELLGCRPDWLLVVVVFFAMHARRSDAAVGAWLIGICADLMTVERPGLLAISYLFAAVAVTSIREYFFRYRMLTQAIVTAVVSLLIRTFWLAYRHVLYDPAESIVAAIVLDVVLASVYTAIWAPLIHRAMLGMSGMFGISRPHYLYAGLHRSGAARV